MPSDVTITEVSLCHVQILFALKISQAPESGEIMSCSSVQIKFKTTSGTSTGLQCQLDYDDRPITGWETCSSPYTIQHHDNGHYTFRVKVIHPLLQAIETTAPALQTGLVVGMAEDPVKTVSWYVDRSPPNTTIQEPFPDNNARDVRFYFSGTDEETDVSHYECELDEQGWFACTSPQAISVVSVFLFFES